MLRYSLSDYPLSGSDACGMLRLYHVARLHTRKPTRFLASMKNRQFLMCRRKPSRHSLLLYVHQGEFTLLIDGEVRKLLRYDALFIRPCHDVEIYGKEDENGEISVTEFDCLPHFEPLYCKDGVFYARGAALLEDKIESVEQMEDYGTCYAESSLLLLLKALSDYADTVKRAEVYAGILRYLRSHQGDLVTVAELATALRYHPSYLNTVAKKHAGKTVQAVINDSRIRTVRAYLGATDLPLERIARLLHFKSAQHMSQFFKRQTGMSPTHYRHAHT